MHVYPPFSTAIQSGHHTHHAYPQQQQGSAAQVSAMSSTLMIDALLKSFAEAESAGQLSAVGLAQSIQRQGLNQYNKRAGNQSQHDASASASIQQDLGATGEAKPALKRKRDSVEGVYGTSAEGEQVGPFEKKKRVYKPRAPKNFTANTESLPPMKQQHSAGTPSSPPLDSTSGSKTESRSLLTPQASRVELLSGQKDAHRKRKKRERDEISDDLWVCKECGSDAKDTSIKRVGLDNERNLCNACYIKLRNRIEKQERGSARPAKNADGSFAILSKDGVKAYTSTAGSSSTLPPIRISPQRHRTTTEFPRPTHKSPAISLYHFPMSIQPPQGLAQFVSTSPRIWPTYAPTLPSKSLSPYLFETPNTALPPLTMEEAIHILSRGDEEKSPAVQAASSTVPHMSPLQITPVHSWFPMQFPATTAPVSQIDACLKTMMEAEEIHRATSHSPEYVQRHGSLVAGSFEKVTEPTTIRKRKRERKGGKEFSKGVEKAASVARKRKRGSDEPKDGAVVPPTRPPPTPKKQANPSNQDQVSSPTAASHGTVGGPLPALGVATLQPTTSDTSYSPELTADMWDELFLACGRGFQQ
ncbi:hypothetical protein HDV05_008253 [Chytridiales sp. JEL 0842]|nr:hypothetical protein HDV05_008253 [Chytridiales sp. JEL 0842]